MKLNQAILLGISILFTFNLFAQVVYVKHDATGANDGSSWANAYTELTDAINNTQAGSQLWVAAGTYNPGIYILLNKNLEIYGGFNGTETSLNQRDWVGNQSILSGDNSDDDFPNDFTTNRSDNAKHLIWMTTAVNNSTILDGIYFRNGHTLGANGSGDDTRGAAILSYGSPVIKNCQFEQNFSRFGTIHLRNAGASQSKIMNCTIKDNLSYNGGGIYALSVNNIQLHKTNFINNIAESFGGGIYFGIAVASIDSCYFSQNVGPDTGGAIVLINGEYTVLNSEFDGNTAKNSINNSSSGGIYHGTSGGGPSLLVLRNSKFTNNESNFGGALSNVGANANGIIEDCIFENNIATNSGGAISSSFSSVSAIRNCVIKNNSAAYGGGLYSVDANSFVTLESIHFEGNSALGNYDSEGGAIKLSGTTTMDITNSNFINNESEAGGAIHTEELSLDGANLEVGNSYFISNIAAFEGGAINLHNCDLKLTNCAFSDNGGNLVTGGGIHVNGYAGGNQVVDIMNTSFGENKASIGASIAHQVNGLQSTINLQNTILGNDPTGVSNYEVLMGSPVVNSLGGNLSADGSLSTVLVGPNDLNNTNPQFVDATNQDLHLQASSPCINKGIVAGAPLTDIEGNPRVGITDMGAYESAVSTSIYSIEEDALALKVFPNPAYDVLNVSLDYPREGNTTVELLGVNGAVLMKKTVNKAREPLETQFNVRQLANGIYKIKVMHNGQLFTRPFIKAK